MTDIEYTTLFKTIIEEFDEKELNAILGIVNSFGPSINLFGNLSVFKRITKEQLSEVTIGFIISCLNEWKEKQNKVLSYVSQDSTTGFVIDIDA